MPSFSPDKSEPAALLFRRDLRLTDHPALSSAAKHDHLHCLFVVDPKREHKGGASDWWLHFALQSLQDELEKKGQFLTVVRGDTVEQTISFCKTHKISYLYAARGYSPLERDQDADLIAGVSNRKSTQLDFSLGNYLFEPEFGCKADETPYRVYTPFWRSFVKKNVEICAFKTPRLPLYEGVRKRTPELGLLSKIGWDEEFYNCWEPTIASAQKTLKNFIKRAASGYKVQRDLPGVAGTSRLSPYLAFGQISPRKIWQGCIQEFGPLDQIEDKYPGVYTYLKEIVWREFANHLLFHFPRTVDEELQPAFRKFPWKKNKSSEMRRKLKAWQTGSTGVPIVDAGMRQLWRTGWMHNRVRMVVASFLVKNLGLDWRYGADWFMDTLVDADIASNTMGWQWAAGSGADAAPYFRVFNPSLQGERFDKQGAYVKKYVPELTAAPDKFLHRPWELPPLEKVGLEDYPDPLVCLKKSREDAIARYQKFKVS